MDVVKIVAFFSKTQIWNSTVTFSPASAGNLNWAWAWHSSAPTCSPFYTARSAGQKGCVNRLKLRYSSKFRRLKGPIRVNQINWSCPVIGRRGWVWLSGQHGWVWLSACTQILLGLKTGCGLCGLRKGIWIFCIIGGSINRICMWENLAFTWNI